MPEQAVNELEEENLRTHPSKAAYVLHIRQSMRQIVVPSGPPKEQPQSIKPTLKPAPLSRAGSGIPAPTSRLRAPSLTNAPTKLFNRPLSFTPSTAPSTSTSPAPAINVVPPSAKVAPTPTPTSPAAQPQRRLRPTTIPRTWGSPPPPPAGSPTTAPPVATSPQALKSMIAAKFLDPKFGAKPPPAAAPEPERRASVQAEPKPDAVEKQPEKAEVPKPEPEKPQKEPEKEQPKEPEKEIPVWDIDDMCVIETPPETKPQPSLLEKMKDVAMLEEEARLAEYASLEIVIIRAPDTKTVRGILRPSSTRGSGQHIKITDTVIEMEHFMYEQEEAEREEEEERKRLERLAQSDDEEDEDDYIPQFMADDAEEAEDEGDEEEEKEEADSKENEDEEDEPPSKDTPNNTPSKDTPSKEEVQDTIKSGPKTTVIPARKKLMDRTKKGGTLGRNFKAPAQPDDLEESTGESALDAWKRAMEEKTQKMRSGASTHVPEGDSEDGKRVFRVQPRPWAGASANIGIGNDTTSSTSSTSSNSTTSTTDSTSTHEGERRRPQVQPRAWAGAASQLQTPETSESKDDDSDDKKTPEQQLVKIPAKKKVILGRTSKGNTIGRKGWVPPAEPDDSDGVSGESALDAWKRAMEEKTQKMKAVAASKEGADSTSNT